MLQNIDLYIGLIITGLCTGLGSAIANYFVNKHLIERIENIKKRHGRTR
jgi:hypothetical protein